MTIYSLQFLKPTTLHFTILQSYKLQSLRKHRYVVKDGHFRNHGFWGGREGFKVDEGRVVRDVPGEDGAQGHDDGT